MKNKTLTTESLLALDCLRHHFTGRDGVGILGTKFPCQATTCLVRERNLENAPARKTSKFFHANVGFIGILLRIRAVSGISKIPLDKRLKI